MGNDDIEKINKHIKKEQITQGLHGGFGIPKLKIPRWKRLFNNGVFLSKRDFPCHWKGRVAYYKMMSLFYKKASEIYDNAIHLVRIEYDRQYILSYEKKQKKKKIEKTKKEIAEMATFLKENGISIDLYMMGLLDKDC